MEYFYREMRRRTGMLMEGGEPAGGRWNFDTENRKAGKPDLFMPRSRRIAPDAGAGGQAFPKAPRKYHPKNDFE